ncbi:MULTISPECIES: hypothetical protein [Streptomyces]|uniref:hypothetical protein n=1 Tax=Streptomyces TaxID=1883 RepID=UPI0013DA2C74|nr:hypothetical protein [Streptomyces aureoverticillatus]QIB44426.1 hypothetical protein G3H79_16375 [Streptomyces aureoverticillatus]
MNLHTHKTLGVSALALLLAGSTVAAAQGRQAVAERTPAAPVDLALDVTNLSVAPQGSGKQTFTVVNQGKRATTEPGRLVYVTPTYFNFASVPKGCQRKLRNPDPLVPEIMECAVPKGLGPGKKFKVDFTLSATKTNLVGSVYGAALVSPDVEADPEMNFSDNYNVPDAAIRRSAPPNITGHRANVHLSYTSPAVAPDERAEQTFTYGNQGPDATVDPVRLVYVTPFFVNFSEKPLPRACRLLLDDPDPLIPQVVECDRDRPLEAGRKGSYTFEITAVEGGPSGMVFSPAVVAEAKPGMASTHDPSVIDNLANVGVNELPSLSQQ